MFKKPVITFFTILVVVWISTLISLPKNYPLKFSLGPLNIDRIISSPNLDINIGPIHLGRDLNLKLGLDLKGGTQLVYGLDVSNLSGDDKNDALAAVRKVIERRVNLFGISEANVQESKSQDNYRVIVELPGVEDVTDALSLIGQTAQLDFREEADVPPEATASGLIDPQVLFSIKTPLTGKNLKKSSVVFDQNTGEPQVSLEFNAQGKDFFADITQRNVGKRLAIFLDESLVSAPVVNVAINDGKAVIQGNFTVETARELSQQLNAGALPVPIHIIEQKNIGPTLGQESINKSVIAGMVGIVLVIFFMIGNYGWLGIIAVFALASYAVISLALYKLIPITLTLPGITGFILSIGMAVDSNILIFERIKEEKRNGRALGVAMELGFGRAWDSIRDANIATLLICFILFNPFDWNFLITSGLIRGFATTLALGIFLSLFTGIVVTRTLIRLFYRQK